MAYLHDSESCKSDEKRLVLNFHFVKIYENILHNDENNRQALTLNVKVVILNNI